MFKMKWIICQPIFLFSNLSNYFFFSFSKTEAKRRVKNNSVILKKPIYLRRLQVLCFFNLINDIAG